MISDFWVGRFMKIGYYQLNHSKNAFDIGEKSDMGRLVGRSKIAPKNQISYVDGPKIS